MSDTNSTAPALVRRTPGEMRHLASQAPEWLVSGLVPSRAVVVLAGGPGIGKSFTALSWAAAVATGQPWCDRGVKQGRALYVLGEGFARFGQRIEAWENVNGDLGDGLGFIDGAAAWVDLSNPQSVERLIETVKSDGAEMLVLDTFAMLANISNENDNAEVGNAMRAAHRIVSECACTVVLVHHVSKALGQVRGATAFRGNADTVITAVEEKGKEGKPSTFALSTRGDDDGKQRDGEPVKLHGFAVVSPGVLGRKDDAAATGAAADALATMAAAAAKA